MSNDTADGPLVDFGPVRAGELELAELGRRFGPVELASATRALMTTIRDQLAGADDGAVTFVPADPEAADTFALDPAEVSLPWTLGHVIVHLTASAEETAFLAAELARGVEPHGRSRREVPWPTVTSIAACEQRLAESERMILATLAIWPDQPDLEVAFTNPRGSVRNAPARFLGGLMHADEHLGQIAGILGQARMSGA
jgi:DinB superfamily